jgi:uncharacterized ferritin-like protein (DUF455 family)
MAAQLDRVGDPESGAVLRHIYADEIGHVAIGRRWFDDLCAASGLDPAAVFAARVRRCFKGDLKPPFNHAARAAAGMPRRYYEPLAASAAAGPRS